MKTKKAAKKGPPLSIGQRQVAAARQQREMKSLDRPKKKKMTKEKSHVRREMDEYERQHAAEIAREMERIRRMDFKRKQRRIAKKIQEKKFAKDVRAAKKWIEETYPEVLLPDCFQ